MDKDGNYLSDYDLKELMAKTDRGDHLQGFQAIFKI